MIVEQLHRSVRGNEMTFAFSDGEQLTVSAADFRKFPFPEPEEELCPFEVTEEQAASLRLYDEKLRAVKYAAYLLGFSDKTEKKLKLKLKEKEYSEQSIALTIETLKSMGILDDNALCRRKLVGLANGKLYGPYRIKQELYLAGFDRVTTEEAFADCSVDFFENAAKLFQKLARRTDLTDRKEQKKLSDKMARYGYAFETIRACFDTNFEESDFIES